MSALDDMTAVIEEHPETLQAIRQLVRGSAGSDEEFRAHTLGTEIVDLLVQGATGAAQGVLKQLLEQVDHQELGRWYIDCFALDAWPMWMWSDAGSVDDEGREKMRADLLEVRNRYGFDFPDEEAVFAYLDDDRNDLGDIAETPTALEIAKLWKRRYRETYTSWDEFADTHLGSDAQTALRYLKGAATNEQAQVLDDVKAAYGKAIAEAEEADTCFIDRLSSHGELFALERRD